MVCFQQDLLCYQSFGVFFSRRQMRMMTEETKPNVSADTADGEGRCSVCTLVRKRNDYSEQRRDGVLFFNTGLPGQ